ncbi:MFS transporter [Marinomonas mediterranea]|uniref:MFS transporter n=1 Tax=Marinomonas mediterranea TaxID=119864 RepID=UPI0023491ADA|nr:MFS transporter [Marinomonas mediterranea]WCN11168.1 MFS transporter [Marinomonas mediterranea]WCN15230.1 MFS transporter [Marinomonas mediterranea]
MANLNRIFTPFFACSGILLALGSIVMVQPIFAEVGLSLGVPSTDVRVSFSIVSLSYAVAFFLFGPLTDRLNIKWLGAFSSLALAVSCALLSQGQDILFFNLAISVVGISAAGIVSSMFPYMTKIAQEKQRGKYLGYCLSATVTGIIFGRAYTGVVADYYDWQLAILTYSVLCLFLFVVMLTLKPVSVTQSQLSMLGQYSQSLSLLKNTTVLSSYLAGFSLFIAYLGTLTFLTYHLVEPPFLYATSDIGWVSFSGFLAAFLAPMAGGFAQKYGFQKMVLTGVFLVLCALGELYFAENFIELLIGLLMLYSGVYICQPAVFFHITQLIPGNKIGAASSFYLLSCLAGGSFGSFILGMVWDQWGWAGITLANCLAVVITLILTLRRQPQPNFQPKETSI